MQVFKLKHEGSTAPEMITVGVRVSDESVRETLEVPVVFSWDSPDGHLSENRTYTFVKYFRKRANRTTIQERSTRFLTCPRSVAELLAGVEFQARDSENILRRGTWLDVRIANTQQAFDRADSLTPPATMKAETAAEPPGLLREKKVVRTGPAKQASTPATPDNAKDADPAAERGQAEQGPDWEARRTFLESETNAALTKRAEALGIEVGTKPVKANLVDWILSAERGQAEQGG
jgi:hypothetical protein